MNKMTVRDIDLHGKRVLVRVDFNVPLEGSKITDDTRIRAAVPTLQYILQQKPKSVLFAADCVGQVAKEAAAKLSDGGVLLLENTRFHKGEEKNDLELAQQMAKLGDVYVNDAFGSA